MVMAWAMASAQRWASPARWALCGLLGLGACGGDGDGMTGVDTTTAPVTITFLRHDNPNYRSADNAYFADYVAKHPNVKIDDTTVDFRTLASELNGNLKSDQFAYDLVLVPPGRLCSYAENVADVPAEIVKLSDAQNTFFPAPLEGSICGGKLKGLPVEFNLEYGGVVVNIDKFEAKFQRKPGWLEWEQFIADAEALVEYDEAGQPRANGLDIDPGWSPPTRHIFFGQILQRNGRYWSLSDPGLLDLQTAEARATLATMVDWVLRRKVMFTSLIPDKNTGVSTRLAAGATGFGWSDPARPLSAMGYIGTWGVPSVAGQVPTGSTWRYEFHALPPMVGTEHKFVTDSGWAFAVPRTSKNQRVAWEVAAGLALSAENMRRWSMVTGALPALRANGSATAASSNPALQRVLALLERGHWRGYIPAPALDVANATVVSNFFAVVRGEKSVDQALLDMEMTANAAILAHR